MASRLWRPPNAVHGALSRACGEWAERAGGVAPDPVEPDDGPTGRQTGYFVHLSSSTLTACDRCPLPEVPFVPPFHLGLVAPAGFDVDRLGPKVWARLRPLLDRRLRRREPIFFYGVSMEPLTAAVREVVAEKGISVVGLGGRSDRPRVLIHRASLLEVAALVNAVVIVHSGGELPADMAELLRVCQWLGTPTRVVALGQEHPTR
jgi:hypothetical protein